MRREIDLNIARTFEPQLLSSQLEITSMRIPPLNQLEISLPGPDDLSRNVRDNSNDASMTSELSIDILTKERSDDRQHFSSTSCRWNPDDFDYSLNMLLPPTREESPESSMHRNTSAGSSNDDSTTSGQLVTNDSLSASLLGPDYSLSKIRPPSSKLVLDSSTSTAGTVDTEFSSSQKSTKPVPEDIDVPSKPATSAVQTARKRQSSISFYPRVRIQRIPPRKSLSEQQVEAVWYSRDEFQIIRQECFQTIKLMGDDDEDKTDIDNPIFDDETSEQLCRRGLEYKTPNAYKHRQKQKREIRKVVLEEQEFQDEADMIDPEWLAKLCRDQSRSCVFKAILVAAKDAEEARLYYGEEGWS
jgi:hypothetical protein